MWGSDVGFVIPLSNTAPIRSPSSLFDNHGFYSRQTERERERERLVAVNEGLSPRDRKHTTYTRRERERERERATDSLKKLSKNN